MKKLLLIALGWMIFSSCAKNVNTPNAQSANDLSQIIVDTVTDNPGTPQPSIREVAEVAYVADLGWVLKASGDTYQVPDNLPVDFHKSGLLVMVVYSLRDQNGKGSLTGGIVYIHIENIKILSPTD